MDFKINQENENRHFPEKPPQKIRKHKMATNEEPMIKRKQTKWSDTYHQNEETVLVRTCMLTICLLYELTPAHTALKHIISRRHPPQNPGDDRKRSGHS